MALNNTERPEKVEIMNSMSTGCLNLLTNNEKINQQNKQQLSQSI